MTQRIALSGERGAGMFTVIDDHRTELTGRSWSLCGRYAVTGATRPNGRRTKIPMHQMITGCRYVDHKDGDPLNNTDDNLRPSTNAENQHNTGPRGGTSIYKGVHWHRRSRKWMARIRIPGQRIYLGVFADEDDAARAYDAKACELHLAFAQLNFPEEHHRCTGGSIRGRS
jgi:hypothetical protein